MQLNKLFRQEDGKMAAKFVFPGSFSPPTYGHKEVVWKASKILPELTIVCSRNPSKDYWFSEKECVELWKSYALPENVRVLTFPQSISEHLPGDELVMVRGIREARDLIEESEVMEFNRAKFNISSYLYLFTEEKFADVSSTKARNAAQELNFIELSRLVAPMVVSALLEKVLGAENFWMVVGKPGGGKSTFLRLLSEADPQNIVINTDEFNQILRPLADQAFPNEDLIEVALRRPAELASVIGRTWLELLKDKLLNMPRVKNVFVEVAYGLRPENSVFRFLGGKILYLGCRSESHRKRLIERGASELLPFVEKIPGLKESEEIAQRYRLKIELIDTEGSLEDLARQAQRFLTNLKKGDDHVESVLAGFAGALGG